MNPKVRIFLRQPENQFLLVAILVIIIPFYFWGESLNVDVWGLKIFIAGDVVVYILAIALVIGWAIYKISNRFLFRRYLIWLHVAITVGIIILFVATGKWHLKSKASGNAEAFLMRQLMMNRERRISIASVTGVIFILGQFIFLFNLAVGFIRKKPCQRTISGF